MAGGSMYPELRAEQPKSVQGFDSSEGESLAKGGQPLVERNPRARGKSDIPLGFLGYGKDLDMLCTLLCSCTSGSCQWAWGRGEGIVSDSVNVRCVLSQSVIRDQ
jgi:hypothetical protein